MINGWTLIGRCNCSGTTNYKYSRDGYIIYHVKKRMQYHIKKGNSYLYKNQPIATLCATLRSLGFSVSDDCLSQN